MPPSSAAAGPHERVVDDVLTDLRVDPRRGLDPADAADRLAASGPNEIEPRTPPSLLHVIAEAASEPFVILLALSGGLAILLGEVRDGLLILAGLVPIVVADVVTEYRGERALERLRDAAAPRAHVRRAGSVVEILARELVPGDLVTLRVGDIVPADLRITRSDGLALDRAILTGESLPVAAATAPDPPSAALAERHAIAYAGTPVVAGRGEGAVVATGPDTELGRIAAHLGPVDRGRSPLGRELDRLVRILLVVAIALIAITVGLGLFRGAPLADAVLAGIAAAIAAIPEEPPVLLAVILGMGAFRLLRRGVLVRRLSAQETLGAIDLIITDKTGTLTRNRLALERIVTAGGREPTGAERVGLIVGALRAEEDAWPAGLDDRRSSFVRALLDAAGGDDDATGLDPADLLASSPPADGRPWSQTRARRDGGIEELAIGAPEAILELAVGDPERTMWEALVEDHASVARRLVLLARRPGWGTWRVRALFAFADPVRDGVPEALAVAREAGIQTVVVTGDHPATAASIARSAGLVAGRMVSGRELAVMADDEIRALLPDLAIVARATPEDKLRLVRAARGANRLVAVTGDGVNDAPALQRADVGVAMGSGTAVAREASDLVLTDDSFATLMHGLAEGRRIVANVEKGLVFLTSTHVALLGFILLATLAGVGRPLLPIQILWLELFIDLSTSVAFEREPAEPDAMRRPPRPAGRPILTTELFARVTLAGGITCLAALWLLLGSAGDASHARWVAFTALVFGQVVRAYANRSTRLSIVALPSNRLLLAVGLAAIAIQLAIPFVPLLAETFDASPLTLGELGLVAGIAVAPAIVAEFVRRRGRVTWVA